MTNEELPLRQFVLKYYELHTVLLEAPTIGAAAMQAEAIVDKLPKGSRKLEIRVVPEKESA